MRKLLASKTIKTWNEEVDLPIGFYPDSQKRRPQVESEVLSDLRERFGTAGFDLLHYIFYN